MISFADSYRVAGESGAALLPFVQHSRAVYHDAAAAACSGRNRELYLLLVCAHSSGPPARKEDGTMRPHSGWYTIAAGVPLPIGRGRLAYDCDRGPSEVKIVEVLSIEVRIWTPNTFAVDLDEEGSVWRRADVIRW